MRRRLLALIVAAAPSLALAQVEISWTSTAAPFRATAGTTVAVYCPPSMTPGGTVWGSVFYTDDSSICLAAVHALASFDHVRGGTVYFTMQPGREAYVGGETRGVTTMAYGRWGASFRVVGAYPGRTPLEITDSTAMEVTFHTTAEHWRGLDSAIRVVQCPRMRDGGLVWGRDVYADASAICPAAVHAGVIKLATGGGVTLRIEPGRERYPGGVRHGIRSDTASRVDGSFSFPKEQVRVARVVQGEDALPTGRGVAPNTVTVDGMVVSGEIRFFDREPPPPPAMPPQESTGDYTLTWNVTARSFRGQLGAVKTMYCPPGGSAATLWGSGEYTDDSSVCNAAVHSLETFDYERGGTVFITMTPGRDSYAPESRRGVTSSGWESYESSFRIVSGVPGVKPAEVKDTTLREISWATTAQHLRGTTGERRFICPRDPQSFPVWGSDVYADQSSICSAAVHAGVITRTGGKVTVKIEPGRKSYVASTRGEVASQALGVAAGSFSVKR